RTLAVLPGPIPFQTDDPAAELQAVTDERTDSVARLVFIELERRLEAAPAEGAARRADKGTWIDEVVVHRADAIGATHLAARPSSGLLLRSGRGALHDPLRRRALALYRRSLVRSSRLQRKRGKHADTAKKQFSHDTPP